MRISFIGISGRKSTYVLPVVTVAFGKGMKATHLHPKKQLPWSSRKDAGGSGPDRFQDPEVCNQ